MSDTTCTTCTHWVPGDEPTHSSPHGWGECHALPPVVVSRPNGCATVWPTTTGDKGCGAHRQAGGAFPTEGVGGAAPDSSPP